MKRLLLISFLLPVAALAQLSSAEGREIKSLTRKGFASLMRAPVYSYSTSGENIKAQLSETIYNDTSGLYANGEYLMFHDPIAFQSRGEILKFIQTSFISNADYQEFQAWVRDSNARERLYYDLESDLSAFEMLAVGKIADKTKINLTQRLENRELYRFDWSKPVMYDDQKNTASLAGMYLPRAERIYNIRSIDERKLFYKYDVDYSQLKNSAKDSMLLKHIVDQRYRSREIVNTETATILDSYIWAENAAFLHDESAVIARTYRTLNEFSNAPVVGITGLQAAAFCHWKQVQIQQKFSGGHPAKIFVTLPIYEDQQKSPLPVPSLAIPERNYTLQWQISQAEYKEFVKAVQDSIAKERIYFTLRDNAKAWAMLQTKASNFDEELKEWVELDPSDRRYNRRILPFTNAALNAESELMQPVLADEEYRNAVYVYYDFNVIKASAKATYEKDTYYFDESDSRILLMPVAQYSDGELIGKDMNMEFLNSIGQSTSGARSFASYHRLIDKTEISVIPAKGFSNETDGFSKEITYEQAIAFYHWKYGLHDINPAADWQDFVLPSKDQFEKIQRGETVIVASKEIPYPGNTFRYVIHIFKTK